MEDSDISSKPTQVDLHPRSEHRTPREIAEDEAGPIGKTDPDAIYKGAADKNTKRNPPARRSKPSEENTPSRKKPNP